MRRLPLEGRSGSRVLLQAKHQPPHIEDAHFGFAGGGAWSFEPAPRVFAAPGGGKGTVVSGISTLGGGEQLQPETKAMPIKRPTNSDETAEIRMLDSETLSKG